MTSVASQSCQENAVAPPGSTRTNGELVVDAVTDRFALGDLAGEWLSGEDRAQSVISFLRRSGHELLAVILNFTPVPRHDYRVPAPPGAWSEIFNSDAGPYGGSGLLNREWIESEHHACGGRDHSLVVTLPPLGGIVLRLQS